MKAYAPFRQVWHNGLLRRETRPNADFKYSKRLLENAQRIIVRTRETIRRSREVLRISREVQADRERSGLKALRRSLLAESD